MELLEKSPLISEIKSRPTKEASTSPASSEIELNQSSYGDLNLTEVNAKNTTLWNGTDLRQKFLMLYIMLADYLCLFCSSVPSPFFARVVKKRGGSIFYSSLVLQSMMLAMSISSVIFGRYQSAIGCRKLFVAGLGVFGLCQAGFGFLNHIEDFNWFIATGTLLRVFEGIGEGAFSVATLTLTCQEYPLHIGKVFGITEAAVGAGYLSGPLFGGAVFNAVGMVWPMVSSGVVVLIILPFSAVLLKKYTPEEENSKVGECFFNPKVLLILISAGTVFGGIGFCDATITAYLQTVGFSVTSAGLAIFAIGLSYCVTALAVSFLTGLRVWVRRLFMAVGFVGFTTIGLIYTKYQSTSLVYFGSTAMGVFAACSTVPSFEELVHVSEETLGYSNFALHSYLSGAWSFFLGLGMFCLSLVGSVLNRFTGSFSWALFLTCCTGFSFALLVFCAVYWIRFIKNSQSNLT